MGYSIHKQSKMVTVDPRGTIFRPLPSEKISSYDTWVPYLLSILNKNYKVEVCFDNEDYQIIIKPSTKYECTTFETLFGFKPHCSDFTVNKIISFPDDPTKIYQ